jgi:hypothetical protein
MTLVLDPDVAARFVHVVHAIDGESLLRDVHVDGLDIRKFKKFQDAEYTVVDMDVSQQRLPVNGVYDVYEATHDRLPLYGASARKINPSQPSRTALSTIASASPASIGHCTNVLILGSLDVSLLISSLTLT